MTSFIDSFRAEWLKTRRSLAWLLVIGGAVFVPSIILVARLKNYGTLPKFYASEQFWTRTWHQSWEAMIIMLLPIGVTLAAGLLAQIEFRANAWKQVHATPQTLTAIYFAKFAVLLVLTAAVFALFALAVYLTAAIPALIVPGVDLPATPIPWALVGRESAQYFVACLPAAALQFALSVHFRNFMVPLAVGFGIWILGVGMLSWEYSWALPYLPGVWEYLVNAQSDRARTAPVDLSVLSLAYFAVFTLAGWAVYCLKSDKG